MLCSYGDRMIAGGHATGGGRKREDGKTEGGRAAGRMAMSKEEYLSQIDRIVTWDLSGR